MRVLIYVTTIVFVLAGLEMFLLAFAAKPTPVSSISSNGQNSQQRGLQPAALATANPDSLAATGSNLPNSKEEAAAFSKQHQSPFDFGQSAASFKAAGYPLKSSLNLGMAGSKFGNTQVNSSNTGFSKEIQNGIAAQVESLQALAPQAIATTATADYYEPDDSPAQAAQINVTTAPDLSGSQTHTFTTIDDVDWVYFVARKPNVNYTIFTNADNATGVDTKLDLFDSSLNLIASNDDSSTLVGNNPKNSVIHFTPPDTGSVATYYVRIRDVAANSAVGAYFLTVYEETLSGNPSPTAIPTFTPGTAVPTSTPNGCPDAYEPDNSPSRARLLNPSLTTVAAFGTVGFPTVDTTNDGTQPHSICPSGDVDWVYADLVAGKPYSIFTSSLRGGLDTFMILYSVDSAGNITPVYSNDDFTAMGLASRIDWVVPATSSTPLGSFVRYYVAVKDVAGHGGIGLTYNLTLATISNAQGDCNDYYQPDYDPTQAKDIQINQTETHDFCPAGNSHWVRFFAKGNGRTYVLQTIFVRGTPALDTSITVYSVQFDSSTPPKVVSVTPLTTQRVATNADPTDLSTTINFSVPTDGYYYAQVSNAGNIGLPGLTYQLLYGITGGSSNSFNATQTAIAAQTSGSQGNNLTATAAVINSNQTATSIAQTVFAVNNTVTSQAQTATPAGETATASAATATAGAALTPGPTKTAAALPAKLNNAYFADLSFSNVWSRVDKAVSEGVANRSWEFGPKPGPMRMEAYAEASGGVRQVQYFAKSRMEINNPKADSTAAWYVTNGLLVKELISGAVAMGDSKFLPLAAPQIPVAGDLNNNAAPTYSSFSKLITLNNSNRATDLTGQSVNQGLSRDGTVSTLATAPEQINLVNYVPETGHNIPDKFWTYLNSRGQVYQNGQYQDGPLMDWVFVMGLPLSEPYWVKANVGGIERDVLVQVFERRILTYTPANDPAWQVEMGNVGEHYYLWRYGFSLYAATDAKGN
jgi:hypothetical protein